ncbi:MAG: hypothetical protein JEY99_20570 [Spirochaetales bacterium]|nr:hypothetical protein [Spirochaetales bacterium]
MNNKRFRHTMEEGFSIIFSFLIIVVFSTLLISILAGVTTPAGSLSKKEKMDMTHHMIICRKYQKISESLIPLFLEKQPYAPDSPHNRIFKTIEEFEINEEEDMNEDFEITLTDISSRINVNTFRNEITHSGQLPLLLFTDPFGMELIEQYRASTGFFTNLNTLENVFPYLLQEEAITELITVHGYWNLNIADESSLEKLYYMMTDDPAEAELFRFKIRGKRENRETISNNEIFDFLGEDCNHLYPVVSAVPLLNINFIKPELLKAILNHNFGSNPLPNPEESYMKIINQRRIKGIETSNLPEIFGIENTNHPVFDYLGTRTWFWHLNIKGREVELEIEFCIIPAPEISYRLDENNLLLETSQKKRDDNKEKEFVRLIQNHFTFKAVIP